MDETMVERVARAIAGEDINLAAAFSGVGSINQQHREREIAFNMARAAISAMREPTHDMENAGAFFCIQGAGAATKADLMQAVTVYRAMIDAALAGKD